MMYTRQQGANRDAPGRSASPSSPIALPRLVPARCTHRKHLRRHRPRPASATQPDSACERSSIHPSPQQRHQRPPRVPGSRASSATTRRTLHQPRTRRGNGSDSGRAPHHNHHLVMARLAPLRWRVRRAAAIPRHVRAVIVQTRTRAASNRSSRAHPPSPSLLLFPCDSPAGRRSRRWHGTLLFAWSRPQSAGAFGHASKQHFGDIGGVRRYWVPGRSCLDVLRTDRIWSRRQGGVESSTHRPVKAMSCAADPIRPS